MARGFRIGAVNIMQGGNASPEDLLLNKTAFVDGHEIIGNMPNNGTVNELITAVAQQIGILRGYHNGNGIVKIDPTEQTKIIGSNIKTGVNILGVQGQVTPDPSSDGTATASDILLNKVSYSKGNKIVGNIPIQAAKTVTPATSAQTAVNAATYCSGNITVGAIPNQQTGGAKYATTSAQTLVTAPKYITSNITLGALSQSNLASGNILRGKTINISNGSTNVWSVTGSNNVVKCISGVVDPTTTKKSIDGHETYISSFNPGFTPLYCFTTSGDAWMIRYSSTTGNYIIGSANEYTQGFGVLSWTSSKVEVLCATWGTEKCWYWCYGY